VQLHQLTPNSLLHIACFVTLCESFLGIEPHFLLWRSIFRLRPNVALARKPELGGIFHGRLCPRVEDKVVLYQGPQILS
jgi:hypothetical protein